MSNHFHSSARFLLPSFISLSLSSGRVWRVRMSRGCSLISAPRSPISRTSHLQTLVGSLCGAAHVLLSRYCFPFPWIQSLSRWPCILIQPPSDLSFSLILLNSLSQLSFSTLFLSSLSQLSFSPLFLNSLSNILLFCSWNRLSPLSPPPTITWSSSPIVWACGTVPLGTKASVYLSMSPTLTSLCLPLNP
mgnify:CR=1 FL=1